MAFTAGYKVNENTQFEFTVSDETIQEMVQVEGGITDSDLAEYCYSALIDSRVYRIFPEMHVTSMDADWGSTVASQYYAHMAGGPSLTTVKPTFNKDLLNDTDQAYQRNFLVWEGEIYPGTEQAKHGTFLVMDVKNLHNFYVDFNSAGFGTGSVASSDYSQTYPDYGWPGYTGPVYTYTSNTLMHHPIIMTNNNDPQLNPDHNLFVINVMIFNDQLAIAEMNPSTHGNSNIGSEGIAYAPFSDEWLNRGGEYFNWNDPQRHYQGVTGSWGAIGDYRNAYDFPGAPSTEIGSLGFVSYVPLGNDDMLLQLSGQWGQQNAANSLGIEYGSWTTSKSTILKWQSWCGLLFKYEDVFYKPIIQGGVVVGYTDDMDAESEYDDMTNVTGNNISPYPPVPPPSPEDDSDWDDIPINGAGIGGGSAFCRFYYCTEAELANLRTWTMGLSDHGDPIPGGFDPKSNIIGLTVFPFTVSGNGPTTIKFVTNGGQDPVTGQPMPRVVDSGVACEGGAGATVRKLTTTIDVPATMKSRGEPWLDYESYIELYIPMCGVYQVDPQAVIGRTIHVEIYLDPVSGTVMGIAWVTKDSGKCIIAQGSGTPGVQIPVAVGNYGLAQAARVQNTLGAFGNTANSSISTTTVSNAFQNRAGDRSLNGVRKISQNASAGSKVAAFNRSGSAILGFSGLVSSAQHWVSARQIANSPGTSASGGFSGSMAEWCGVFKPYVKIVRPKFRKPENYKHTCGEPEVTKRKLNLTGYTVCINPDVSGLTNATEAERAAVYQYLSTGVYYK